MSRLNPSQELCKWQDARAGKINLAGTLGLGSSSFQGSQICGRMTSSPQPVPLSTFNNYQTDIWAKK